MDKSKKEKTGKTQGSNGIIIRKAVLGDMGQIINNWKCLMDLNSKYNPVANRRKANYVEIYRRFLKKQIKGRKSAIFVAVNDGMIIGHLMMEIKRIPPVYEIDEEGFVDELFVQKEFRRLGIGTLLLEQGEKWARRKGMKQFSLHTNVKNAGARRAYAKFGLVEFMLKLIKPL
ncbi:MAG: GNAT family N-acetyltransferase [Candidatus Micrarchaeia archaeon]